MRTVFGDHERFIQTYFATFKGLYMTGDGARRDEDGYYWITGRVDDVINVSGHRMGTAEVESALVLHPTVSEAAVVGCPHEIKGQGIYAYVTLNAGTEGQRRVEEGARRARPQGDRPHRLARRHPVRAGSAEDPLGQDHAPHPAQGGRERDRRPRRHRRRWPSPPSSTTSSRTGSIVSLRGRRDGIADARAERGGWHGAKDESRR